MLLRPRWLLAHALVLTIVSTFVGLGFWQLGRLDERRTYNRTLTARTSMPVVPVEQLLSGDPGRAAYRRVTVRGTFDPAREIVLLSRSRNSIAGHHVITPVVLGDGETAVLVDRGWVPYQLDTPPIADAAPPAGEVTLTGVLFPSQQRGRFGPRATGEQQTAVFRIDVARLAPQFPYRIAPLWLLLEQQRPAQPGELPASIELPRLDAGPHLSYAIQWYLFAAVLLIGYPLLIRSRRPPRPPDPTREPRAPIAGRSP